MQVIAFEINEEFLLQEQENKKQKTSSENYMNFSILALHSVLKKDKRKIASFLLGFYFKFRGSTNVLTSLT